MQVGELDDNIFIELKVAGLFDTLATHHVDKRLIPLHHLLALGIGELKSVNDTGRYAVYIKIVGTYYILYLPHIQQIFGDILFVFL